MTGINDNNIGQMNNYDPELFNNDLEGQMKINDNYELCSTTPTYVRHDFIKKVFSITFLQLLFIFAFSLVCYNVDPIRKFFLRYPIYVHIALFFYLMSILVLSCFPNTMKNSKVSIGCLFVLTPTLGFVLAGYCSAFTSKEINIALGLTLLTVGILIALAFQTKYDFTRWIFPLIIVSFNVFVVFILTFFLKGRIKQLIFTGIGLAIVSLYLVIDIQMIIGGSHRYMFTVDEYTFASLCVTTDIVTIFMDLLRFVRF